MATARTGTSVGTLYIAAPHSSSDTSIPSDTALPIHSERRAESATARAISRSR